MNQIAFVNFEIIKNDRKYVFAVMPGSPYSECCEALAEFSNEILAMAKVGEEKQKAEEALKDSSAAEGVDEQEGE